jgi:hypothetical protein
MTSQAMPRVISRKFPHFPRRMLVDYSAFSAIIAAGAIAAIMVITVGVSIYRPIEASGWDLSQQIVNWFVLALCTHIGYREFSLYVTHGQTRRNFFGEAVIFVVLFALAMALLYALGFWIEAPLYALMGWPQAVHEPRIYAQVLDTPRVILEMWPSLLLWAAAGLALGAAFYRNGLLGTLYIGLGLLMAQLTSLAMGQDAGPVGVLVRMDIVPGEINVPLALLAHLAATAFLLAAAWLAMRDAPIHARKQ